MIPKWPKGSTLPEATLGSEKWLYAKELISEIERDDIREVCTGRSYSDLGLRFERELRRAYKAFTERFDGGYESERVFKRAVVEVLARGNVEKLGDTSWIRWLGE